jgi:DNA-binding NarL/FixJ family response regulator
VLPILVFSGNPMQERVDQFYAVGANGFIYKGTGFDECSRQLADLISYWTDLLVLPSRPKA